MGLDERDVAEQIANGDNANDPDQRTYHVEHRELGAGHVGHAGHERHEGAHERHEARQHQGDAAVLLVEGMGLLEGAADILFASDTATEVENIGTGLNIFLWTVENGVCPTTSDTMLITINDCADFTIPDAFSPNGDGVNDLYVIEGLEAYRNNSFQVYNRWGTQVLERSPYNNNWDGRSEASLNWGEELPEGTYYYILDLGNGDEPYTGYIYLKR